MFNLAKKIMKPVSVSGREQAVAGVIAEEIAPYVDSVRLDAMGNLLAFRAGTGEKKKKLLFAAHIDEIGFLVTYIEENGFLRFQTIGGVSFASAAYTHVIFENGVRGVLVPETGVGANDFRQDKFVVDIGAKNRKDAERKVKIGDAFAVVSDLVKLSGSRVAGRPLDDRIGAVVLLEAARRLETCENDVTFAFTTQEEVGCRGSKTAAFGVTPDVGIALDVTGTGDTPGAKPMKVALGDGAAIKIKDSSVICDRWLVEKMKDAAKANGIKYQLEILAAGGTDTSSIQQNAAGAVAGCISIPTRYIHSTVETVDLADVEECVKLTAALCHADFSDLDR